MSVITFATTSHHLDTARIFTSLSYLLLLLNPLTQLFQWIPQIIAAATCFGRVEEFLETASQIDGRNVRVIREVASNDTTAYSDAAIVIRNGQFGREEGKFEQHQSEHFKIEIDSSRGSNDFRKIHTLQSAPWRKSYRRRRRDLS